MPTNRGLGSQEQNDMFLERARELAREAVDDSHLDELLGMPFADAYPGWRMTKMEVANPLSSEFDFTVKLWMRHRDGKRKLLQGRSEHRTLAIIYALMGEPVEV